MPSRAPVALLLLALGCASTRAPAPSGAERTAPLALPADAGTSEADAVHLLQRLAYGPSPADLAEVRRLGPAAWVARQLRPGDIDDGAVEARLSSLPTLTLSTAELEARYPRARKAALASARTSDAAPSEGAGTTASPEGPEARSRPEPDDAGDGSHGPRRVQSELAAARLVRAVESRRQLDEVLVDFWFNHFNVSADKGAVRWMVSPYEREAIRPHVLGRFRDLLGAVAHHPAMLFYLDNWASTRDGFVRRRGKDKGAAGLNENYARELLELHTLGVDGGYTQADVREVARCFTGWTIRKPQEDGTFLFRAEAHDRGEKHVLGTVIPAGGGMEDGERVLDLLARHPATARFLATKLARKLVSDTPPPALVERVAQVFLRTDGDLTATVRALVESPEFWAEEARASKVKTPLEFVASSVRSLGGTTDGGRPVLGALARMGQPPYRAQPPTGWPEVAQPWVNPGALVARIDFGLRLANGRLGATRVPLPAVQDATAEAAVDRVAREVLHRPLSEASRATVLAALGVSPDAAVMDGERPRVDAARVVGLLLGSPEFQNQ